MGWPVFVRFTQVQVLIFRGVPVLEERMYNCSVHKPKRAGENDADRTISHDARLLNGSCIFFLLLVFRHSLLMLFGCPESLFYKHLDLCYWGKKKECEKQYGMQEYRKMLFNSQTAYWVLISVEERSAWGSLHTSAAHVWLFLICCLCRFVLINVLRTNTAQIFTYSPMSFCLISACLEMLICSTILVEISYVLAFDSAFLFLLCLLWIEIKRKCWFFSWTLVWSLFV